MSGGSVVELGGDLIQYVNSMSDESNDTEFVKACSGFLEAGDLSSFIKKVIENKDVVFEKSNTPDAEGCFSIMATIIGSHVKDADARTALIDVFTGAVTDNTTERKEMRLTIITNLYNALAPSSADRFKVFMVLARYASTSQQLHLFYRHIYNVDPKSWNLGLDDTRTLYKIVAEITSRSTRPEVMATSQAYTVKLLATYEGQDDIADVKDVAVAGVVGAIKSAVSSFTRSESMIEFSAVKQLEGDSNEKYNLTFELLKVFTSGNVEQFIQFQKKNRSFLEAQGISQDEALTNIRLLSICSLASEHEEIPYAEIAKILQIEANEVENWVVKATAAKLMDAKMDQLGQVVIIKRCSQRIFGINEWKQLGTKLSAWKENVRAMLSTIENARSEN